MSTDDQSAPDGKAIEQLLAALRHTARAYGIRLSIGTSWCVAWGGEDANDCAGRLEYDDEADARDMTQWIPGGIVARQAVISLPWETVPDEAQREEAGR
jgi:hypothetical protein